MKRSPMPDIKDRAVNVTPLIDIVMCMIVFLYVAARNRSWPTERIDHRHPVSILGKRIEQGWKTHDQTCAS